MGRLERGPLPLNINHRENCQLQTPTEESSLGKNDQLQVPTGKDATESSKRSQLAFTTQLMTNYHHPEFLLFSNGLSFKTTPPNFFLLLDKITFPSFFFVKLAYGFAIAYTSSSAILCPSQTNPFFAGKITFIFKVNSMHIQIPV